MNKSKMPLLAAALAVGAAPSAADAAIIVNIFQNGANVDLVVAGTLNVTGLTGPATTSKGVSYLVGSAATLSSGASGALSVFGGLTGPTSFGTGARFNATSTTGNRFELFGAQGQVKVENTFVSGDAVASSSTYANRTLASMGLNSGTYTFTAPQDTITVIIGTAPAAAGPVPEPASWGMMLLGFGTVGHVLRRRRQPTRRIRFV